MGITERKKRERESQQKRRQTQILEAAKRVFHQKGYSAATIDDIAASAELSPAALYIYFKNKDDIYVSLNLQLLNYLYKKLSVLAKDKDLNADQKVEALKNLFYDVFCFDHLILVNLFHLQASDGLQNLPAERARMLNEIAASCIRTLSSILEQGMNQGLFDRYHPTALADIIWSTFTGTVLWEESKRMVNPDKNFFKDTLGLAIDLFRKGIQAGGLSGSGAAYGRL
ncbi:MAG: TetR/AcrR family transcriptional regulator [Deltaproteobacteria bacterium CG_4_8_14_3_um_filter_51_11]|nr:TetR/AcrR family transcriptional regulator [bacterium]OIP39348.1 MAG: hypothetical protein AUK25_10630 [Desulfobacteraceae bacterium CG2_30_51_40]PIP46200.1 MAG: TetR family transcriptional regulator [Deltaproteobacteria bacterium CG23_combo_of_CG06-09_8_20_14_all_51_20]PIW01147.1 MAG: TetR/AcrR family transcriptional regulator [Deltaproteobacteria bacterium CG17_big_fil_post_rev_8_21_14_2_50_51_6]PIX19087.1 MAG: TetR/AcrR family transcriptional regulator [Deltaproteobacteria bacterium CG_4_